MGRTPGAVWQAGGLPMVIAGGLPMVIAGSLKIVYDMLLIVSFCSLSEHRPKK